MAKRRELETTAQALHLQGRLKDAGDGPEEAAGLALRHLARRIRDTLCAVNILSVMNVFLRVTVCLLWFGEAVCNRLPVPSSAKLTLRRGVNSTHVLRTQQRAAGPHAEFASSACRFRVLRSLRARLLSCTRAGTMQRCRQKQHLRGGVCADHRSRICQRERQRRHPVHQVIQPADHNLATSAVCSSTDFAEVCLPETASREADRSSRYSSSSCRLQATDVLKHTTRGRRMVFRNTCITLMRR